MKHLKRAFPVGILLLSITLSPVVSAESAKVGNSLATTNIFVDLSKKVVPSVVNISTLSTVKSPLVQGSPDDLFRRFFEDFFRHRGGDHGGEDEEDQGQAPAPSPNGKLPKAMSLGTGFIIDASGLILTNNHVVADADEIKVNFTENSEEKATDGTVVGRDPEIDVALIRVKTTRDLAPMALGDSDALAVGEYVMAVGNPFGQGHSVTHGIISAKGRLLPISLLRTTFKPTHRLTRATQADLSSISMAKSSASITRSKRAPRASASRSQSIWLKKFCLNFAPRARLRAATSEFT